MKLTPERMNALIYAHQILKTDDASAPVRGAAASWLEIAFGDFVPFAMRLVDEPAAEPMSAELRKALDDAM